MTSYSVKGMEIQHSLLILILHQDITDVTNHALILCTSSEIMYTSIYIAPNKEPYCWKFNSKGIMINRNFCDFCLLDTLLYDFLSKMSPFKTASCNIILLQMQLSEISYVSAHFDTVVSLSLWLKYIYNIYTGCFVCNLLSFTQNILQMSNFWDASLNIFKKYPCNNNIYHKISQLSVTFPNLMNTYSSSSWSTLSCKCVELYTGSLLELIVRFPNVSSQVLELPSFARSLTFFPWAIFCAVSFSGFSFISSLFTNDSALLLWDGIVAGEISLSWWWE